jgi:hypothetical protein
MRSELALATCGMILLAAGTFRIDSRRLRRLSGAAFGFMLCISGVILVTMAAVRAAPGWAARLGATGTCSAGAALLGGTAAAALLRRRAGPVLASLGSGAPAGLRVVTMIVVPVGFAGVLMQLADAPRPAAGLVLIGQSLFFAAFGARSLMMVRTRWALAEFGIVGPAVFVPWEAVSWEWQDPRTLAITTRAAFGGPRRFTVPVAPEARERADAVLAAKAAGR